MKVREYFLQAVSIVEAGDDARAVWVSMNRKNAPWAAVRAEGGRLIGLLRGDEISARVAAPETFYMAGELVEEEASSARALRVSPDAELGEPFVSGADAGGRSRATVPLGKSVRQGTYSARFLSQLAW